MLGAALAGVAAALPLCVWLRGFMVDDALISARYAANLAAGHGYRFNPGGPVTDGVTPLGWAYALSPFASAGVWQAYRAAKLLGIGGWLATCALLGIAVYRLEGTRGKWLGLLLVAASAPLAAWAAAGMETGVIIALAGASVAARALSRELTSAAAAGVVAAWRPEAIPWAVALALGPARDDAPRRSRWWKLCLAAGPGFAVAMVRLAVFGQTLPLGAIAKPSTSALGARYALACAILTGVVALLAYRGLPGWIRGLQAAVAVHFVAIALAGGDWMPVSRLATPALPGLALAAAAIAGRPPPPGKRGRIVAHLLGGTRLACALAGELFVIATQGPKLARVEERRLAVIEALREPIAAGGTVAALDIGWVGAVTPATVVDLAGVTDPEVAVLRGGHTSKWIPLWFVEARHVDALVLRLADDTSLAEPWFASAFGTQVEQWMARQPDIQETFVVRAQNDADPHYVVLVRADKLN